MSGVGLPALARWTAMFRIVGQASSPFAAVIGEITTERVPFYDRHDRILLTNKIDMGCTGYLAVFSTAPPENKFFLPYMVGKINGDDMVHLKHGDIASVSGTGEVFILWEKDSQQNSLMLTEACNCRCIMCPQPPKKHDPALFNVAVRTLDLLKGKSVANICITGGEPTIISDSFLKILYRCHTEHPKAQISILTNAKKFSDSVFAREVAKLSQGNDIFCVSLHSDIAEIHDNIVGVPGSYDETSAGVYNLARYCIPVEIRHVVTKQNYTRLCEFSEHMYRYFPFCAHYALMSMEICGLANDNMDSIYIDPADYKSELRKATLALYKRGLHVSIYNTPLCLCHEDIRVFSRQSISSWKNIHIDECSTCKEKDNCCGFFSTSSVRSSHIAPIY